MKRLFLAITPAALLLLSACATVATPPKTVEAPVSLSQQQAAQQNAILPEIKTYKRKLARARFGNETNYGRALMTDGELANLGRQASDMLMSRLVASGRFLVFERGDLAQVQKEQQLGGYANLIGVDSLIAGSVTEFGRSVSGKSGFLSATKIQTARAKVDIRLIDVRTGQAFFSATGAGEASSESGEIAGFGSYSAYDATLNDRAIAAAISDVIDKLVAKLAERPWRTDIIEVSGKTVFISGGQRQGLKLGDRLQVMQPGQSVKSKQSGFEIALPATPVATLMVTGFFGDNETNEGATCQVVNGTLAKQNIAKLFVEEVKP